MYFLLHPDAGEGIIGQKEFRAPDKLNLVPFGLLVVASRAGRQGKLSIEGAGRHDNPSDGTSGNLVVANDLGKFGVVAIVDIMSGRG